MVMVMQILQTKGNTVWTIGPQESVYDGAEVHG